MYEVHMKCMRECQGQYAYEGQLSWDLSRTIFE